MTYTMDKMLIPVWEWSDALHTISHKFQHRYKDFAASIRKNQWQSKTWLMERLAVINDKENPVIWVLGSWYGSVIVPLIFNYIPDVKRIHLFDYDKEVFEIFLFIVLSIAGILLLVNNKSYDSDDLVINKIKFIVSNKIRNIQSSYTTP